MPSCGLMSLYKALAPRKGDAASVRRQSRQRLRSERRYIFLSRSRRRYRRNRSVRFYRHLERTGSAFPRLPRRFAPRNDKSGDILILAVYSGAQGFLIPAAAGTAPEFEERNGQTIQAGDIFYSVNGERVYLYSDVSLLMSLHQGQPMDLVVLRDGEKVELNDVTWGTYTGTEGETYQGYGVYIARDQIEEANLWTILKTSWLNTIDFVRIVRLSLQMLVTGQAGMDDLSGPVGIVSTITQVGTASETIAAAVENILYFGAMLAVNLAVMNMLPIPALDGGKIFFLIIDEIAMKLFRKKIPEKYEMAVNTVGFVALMGFMLVVTFNDVFKLFG